MQRRKLSPPAPSRTAPRPPAAVSVGLALLALSACGGSDPSGPDPAVLANLGVFVQVEPRFAVAGDTVEVVVTIANDQPEPVTLEGPAACVVSSIRTYRHLSDDSVEPVAFEGGGAQDCPVDGSLMIGPRDSTSLRFPLVLWQVPDPSRPGSEEEVTVYFGGGQGPPLPVHFLVTVHSEVLGMEVDADRALRVLPSGWHLGFAEACETVPPDSPESDPYIAIQPDLVGDAGSMLRTRFEVHAVNTGFELAACWGEIVAAVDRMTSEGWDLGPRVIFCGGGPIPPPIAPGGCLRGVTYRGAYEPADHRLRLWSRFTDEEAAFVSGVFRP